jgi:hypothetical protein
LVELETNGEIGSAALSHYSFIGYTCQPERLLDESVASASSFKTAPVIRR